MFHLKKVFFVSVMILSIIFLVQALPNIEFEDPTPPNATIQRNTDIYVNVSGTDNVDFYQIVDFNEDLNLYLRMDDVNSSGDPTDISTYSNNGTIVGGVTINETGYWGNGSTFDGSTGYINLGDPSDGSLDFGTDDFTISMWVKTTASTNRTLITKSVFSELNPQYYEAGIKETGNFYMQIISTLSGGTVEINSNATSNDGLWHNLVAVYDRDGNGEIYVDGVLTGSSSISAIGTINNNNDVVIGLEKKARGAGDFFSGSIDEVAIFRRTLTQREITAQYSASFYYDKFRDNSLQMLFTFAETNSSGDPLDDSQYEINASFTDDAFVNSTGYIGNGSHYDGDGDSLRFDTTFDMSESFTVAVWIKNTNLNSFNSAHVMAAQSQQLFFITSNSPGTTYFPRWSYYNGTSTTVYGGTSMDSSVWNHIAVVFDSNAQTLKHYQNGVNTVTHTGVSNGNVINTPILAKRGNSASIQFNGSMDEFIFLNKSLSEQDMKKLYDTSIDIKNYENNFTDLSQGDYYIKGYSANTDGDLNMTENRLVTIDFCLCPGSGNNFEVDMSDMCVLTTSCELGTGNWSWVNTGTFTCQAPMSGGLIEFPSTGQGLIIDASCQGNLEFR